MAVASRALPDVVSSTESRPLGVVGSARAVFQALCFGLVRRRRSCLRHPNIRRSIRSECDDSTGNSTDIGGYEKLCEVVNCSNGVCEHDPIRFMRPMLQASFCLQPPGDTPTRRSTFVFIPKEEVVFKGLRILDVLRRIPRARVRRMREKILELIPRVVYRKHNSSPGLRAKKDAFDIAIDGTLDKIQSRL